MIFNDGELHRRKPHEAIVMYQSNFSINHDTINHDTMDQNAQNCSF